MHFVDRTSYTKAPIVELARIDAVEKPKWLAYKQWLSTSKPKPKKNSPTNKWKAAAAIELAELFLCNCGYCGISCDTEREGEVDHYFPKELDVNADYIYDWDNFVWACHSCNNKKSSYYPILDPCSKIDMNEIYFDDTNGKYFCYARASQAIKDKYISTTSYTYINRKKHPENRLLTPQKLLTELENIKLYTTRIRKYINITGVFQPKINKSIAEIKKLVNAGRYLLLIKSIIETKAILNPSTGQPYSFNNFL